MGKRRKRQTPHAEGGHGPQTHERIVEQLQSAPAEPSLVDKLAEEQHRAANHGKRRLVQEREQHDEHDKNSERTRRLKDARTSGIDPRDTV
jgi:hypothetical protein